MLADLHAHSYYSDGELSPRALVLAACKAGAEAFALTDHDTMDGVEEAARTAKEKNLRFVRGVEVSAYDRCDVHILGYDVNPEHKRFAAFESRMRAERENRVLGMLEKLTSLHMKISLDDVRQNVVSRLTRWHVAQALVKKGYAPDVKTCFHTFLDEGAPAYVPKTCLCPCEAVQMIVECGGIAVLAHPMRLKLCKADTQTLAAQLADAGLRGIEAKYKRYNTETEDYFTDMAKKYGLFVTNGGDFHSAAHSEILPREIGEDTAAALRLL